MSEKLTAHYENREYFFTLLSKRPEDKATGAPAEIHIDMYGTLYVFIKQDGKWVNRPRNKMNMVAGLIEAVMQTLELQ